MGENKLLSQLRYLILQKPRVISKFHIKEIIFRQNLVKIKKKASFEQLRKSRTLRELKRKNKLCSFHFLGHCADGYFIIYN